MNRIRANGGDCNLISISGAGWSGFECELNQRKGGTVGPDPADAVLKAFWKLDSLTTPRLRGSTEGR